MPSAICNHGWLRRAAWTTAVSAALMFLSFGATQPAGAQTFTVLHSFTGLDGLDPLGNLILDSSGNLYGTTELGGSTYSRTYSRLGWTTVWGDGTVFKMDTAGNETVVHSFTGWPDGSGPCAGLIPDALGNLYGTTLKGGTSARGTVFKIDAAGNETVLHSFIGGTDGSYPCASLALDAAGNLYGTTSTGGGSACIGYGCGTVFKIDAAGNETVLHAFNGSDGAYPYAGLVLDSAGNLYGTTSQGGGSPCYGSGCGVVFRIDASGNFSVLHSFNGSDGEDPGSSLVLDSLGNLYGSTPIGGSSSNCATGCGIVFKIDAAGNETVLHRFNGFDGEGPGGVILDPSGNLYGMTSLVQTLVLGAVQYQYGTVYRIDAAGNETVLHTFSSGNGAYPYGGLVIDTSGNLYGLTYAGGAANMGIVFKIAFSAPFASFSAKLDIPAGGFQLQAFFTQGTGAAAIDPVAQGMTLTLGTYTVTIPPGSFHQTKKGWFVYDGMIDSVALDIRISKTGANSYELQAEGSGSNFTSLTKPVTVTLALGGNSGTTTVNQ